jgi:hypothetical protein
MVISFKEKKLTTCAHLALAVKRGLYIEMRAGLLKK